MRRFRFKVSRTTSRPTFTISRVQPAAQICIRLCSAGHAAIGATWPLPTMRLETNPRHIPSHRQKLCLIPTSTATVPPFAIANDGEASIARTVFIAASLLT